MADARHDDGVGGAEIDRLGGHEQIGADGGERLLDRRQIPGAVIDQGNPHVSQQPLRAGEHPRQAAVLRAGDAQRAGERLEHRFDVMVARASVQHLDVDVGARADREPFEEIVDELGLQIADAGDARLQIDDGVCGRPPRSMAATASVSSIGITK